MRLSDILKKLQQTKQNTQEDKNSSLANILEKETTYSIFNLIKSEEKSPNIKLVDVEKIYSEAIEVVKQLHKQFWTDSTVSLSSVLMNVAKHIIDGTKKDIDNFLVYSCYTAVANYIYSNSVNVSIYSAIIGNAKNLSENLLNILVLSALLHKVVVYDLNNEIKDINNVKLKIDRTTLPYEIKFKLTRIIQSFYKEKDIKNSILQEDEKLIIQILQICNSYEEMTHVAPNREVLIPHNAISILIKQASQQILDQSLVKLFVDVMSIFPVGSFVKLTTGEIAKVVGINRSMPLRPKVKIMLTPEGVMPKEETIINLAENTKIHIVEPIDETKLNVNDKKFILQVKAQRWWVKDNL